MDVNAVNSTTTISDDGEYVITCEPRCRARVTGGGRCRRPARAGGSLCGRHADGPQARAEAQHRSRLAKAARQAAQREQDSKLVAARQADNADGGMRAWLAACRQAAEGYGR